MANDGEVRIRTEIDNSNLGKGLKDAKKKVNDAAKDMGKGTKATNALKVAFNETGGAASGFASQMGSIASAGGPVAAGITAAVMVTKKYIETLKAANEAYKIQEKAEKALQKAAENNPYLQKESIQRLKEYASKLQEVSNYGDEGTIDIMAQLASTGRTEAEIMKIVGAAADYAAAKHIDLKTAAETLNSTYSGMAGTVGRQIAEIKDLTDEQLKNGEAIDLIASKYKDFAKEAIDSETQAKNAFGDFMESIGKIANPMFEALNQKAKDFWGFMGTQVSNFNDFLETQSRKWGGIKRSVDEGVKLVSGIYTSNKTGEQKTGVSFQNTEYLKWLKEELEWKKKLTDEEKTALLIITDELRARENAAKQAEIEAEEAKKKADEEKKAREEADKKAKAEEDARNAANNAAADSNKKLEESLYALELEAKAKGKSVTAQDRYNVYLNSYLDLLTKTNGLIKEGYPIEQKRLEQLKEAEKALKEATDAEEKRKAAIKLTQEATEAINSIKRDTRPTEQLQKEINALDKLKQKLKEATDEEIKLAQKGQENILSREQLIKGLTEAEKALTEEKIKAIAGIEKSWWDKHKDKQAELLEMKKAIADSEVLTEEEKYKRMKQLDEAYLQSKAQQANELLTLIQGYVNQSVDIINQATNLMLETSKNQATAEQAQLEIKYRKGELSEEEYNKKITESKRKAAREQYKIQMVQWMASILQATANIAQGVTQAIAQGGITGLITGGIVAAAGAVQIGSIIASKPIPPSFSTGGIVGGSSYHGDNIATNLNSREMVMNMSQQKGLWDFINGGSNGQGSSPQIVINNSASNIATAQPRLTRDKIEIIIDARVNDSLKNGRYSSSLNIAQQGMTGEYYGI
jgi:hypothetical protein